MNSFKVGDKVRVKSGVGPFEKVKNLGPNHGTRPYLKSFGRCLHIKAVNTNHVGFHSDDICDPHFIEPWVDGATYDATRREWRDPKPQAAPTPVATYPIPHIVVLRNADGSLAPADVPIQHPSLFAAECEARRLADKHRGQEFCVFSYAGRSARVEPPVMASIDAGDVVRVNWAGGYACPIRGLAVVSNAESDLLWLVADGRVAVCHPFDVTLVAKGVKA